MRIQRTAGLGKARITVGFVLAVTLPPLLEVLLMPAGNDFLAVEVLLQLAAVVTVALVGGLWPALLGALWGSLILNYFSTEPFGSLQIADPENLLTLVIFVGVAVAVSLVVGLAAQRSQEASLASAEAATLGELARGVLAAEDSVQSFLEHVRRHFGVRSAALLKASENDDGARPTPRESPWVPLARSQVPPSSSLAGPPDGGADSDAEAETGVAIDGGYRLVVSGRALSTREQRLLGAFGSQFAAMRQRQELLASTEQNQRLAEGNRMRTAILRAVSHDLRTPLAAIKLAVSSLRQQGVDFSPEEEAELLATIESSSDRLESLIDNLLDMSRLTGDAVTVHLAPVHWPDVVASALRGSGIDSVRVMLPPNSPPVQADFGMLERVIANIAENAQKHAAGSEVVITSAVMGTVDGFPASELRIVDRGRGVDREGAARMFLPFQRLDDAGGATGVGLGLAVARGFTEVMGGRLVAEETPGGGLTMLVRLPLSTGVRP